MRTGETVFTSICVKYIWSCACALGVGGSVPGDARQYLETFYVVTGRGAAGTEWVEAKDAAKHPTRARQLPQ